MVFLLPLLLACADASDARDLAHRAPPADGVPVGRSDVGARHVRTITGFGDPESVRYDAEQDVWFVSNMAGFGSKKDGNGYIVRLDAARLNGGTILVSGGQPGVELHAPKGMAIQGDTLWVADIDVVRGFHRRTGRPVATIDFAAVRPVLLNDVAAGPDGTLRVTDTGIHMVWEGNVHTGPDRILEVTRDRRIVTIAEGPLLNQPNGIAWDSAGRRWLVVSFDRFAGQVGTMRPGADPMRRLLRTGPGQLDGAEPLPDAGVLFSSWADSSIHVLRDGRDTRVIRESPEAADIGVDTRRGRVAIPNATLGFVQVWELGRWYGRVPRRTSNE